MTVQPWTSRCDRAREELKDLGVRLGLSTSGLAQHAHVSRSRLSKFLSGAWSPTASRGLPFVEALERACRFSYLHTTAKNTTQGSLSTLTLDALRDAKVEAHDARVTELLSLGPGPAINLATETIADALNMTSARHRFRMCGNASRLLFVSLNRAAEDPGADCREWSEQLVDGVGYWGHELELGGLAALDELDERARDLDALGAGSLRAKLLNITGGVEFYVGVVGHRGYRTSAARELMASGLDRLANTAEVPVGADVDDFVEERGGGVRLNMLERRLWNVVACSNHFLRDAPRAWRDEAMAPVEACLRTWPTARLRGILEAQDCRFLMEHLESDAVRLVTWTSDASGGGA